MEKKFNDTTKAREATWTGTEDSQKKWAIARKKSIFPIICVLERDRNERLNLGAQKKTVFDGLFNKNKKFICVVKKEREKIFLHSLALAVAAVICFHQASIYI